MQWLYNCYSIFKKYFMAEGLPDTEGGDQGEPVRSKAKHGTPQQPEPKPGSDIQLTAPV